MRSLGSDNHSGVHPEILKSLSAVNDDFEPSYGTDSLSKKLQTKIHDIFGKNWVGFHCFNGTAANVMCLKSLMRSFNSVLCTDVSHLNLDECGAPEFHTGGKLVCVPHQNGKLKASQIQDEVIRLGDQHFSQIKVVSITQPTELGTVYSLSEIQELSEVCKKNRLHLHIDGARLANAVYSLNSSYKEMVQYADAVSLGGTKNGLLGSELVLLKDGFSKNFKFIRKQSMQLPSKTRFLAAQFLRYFEDELYLEIAKESCEKAKTLEKLLKPLFKINYPVQSNALFLNLPKSLVKPLREKLFFYVWDSKTTEVRLMTSFNTSLEDLQLFKDTALKILGDTNDK